jgi:hypothetical protein
VKRRPSQSTPQHPWTSTSRPDRASAVHSPAVEAVRFQIGSCSLSNWIFLRSASVSFPLHTVVHEHASTTSSVRFIVRRCCRRRRFSGPERAIRLAGKDLCAANLQQNTPPEQIQAKRRHSEARGRMPRRRQTGPIAIERRITISKLQKVQTT